VAAHDRATLPPLLSRIEIPSSYEITRHNGHVCRFRGWVASTRDRPTAVRVRLADGPSREIPVSLDRPDLLDTLRNICDLSDSRVGFDFYLDLPSRPWHTPPEITVELTDGDASVPGTVYRVGPNTEHVLETYDNDSPAKRRLAARWLHGRGLEFGALHQPLSVDSDRATVKYADRLTKAEALAVFPEAGPFADAIVEPQFLVDLNDGDLTVLQEEQFDFFVACDVIEHVANPMLSLEAIHDAMKPGARLLLSVPDRHFTHDADRTLTSNRHLRREYRRRATRVDNRHVRRFLVDVHKLQIPWTPSIREQALQFGHRRHLYNIHRERSFHVHVWDNESFDRFLAFARKVIPLRFAVLDEVSSREAGGAMVYVLERQAPC
jgi:SAM-dependent methyltransferase